MSDWVVGNGGQLVWTGAGPAPYLSPEQQQQVRSSGGGDTPTGAQYGVYSPYPGAAPVPLPSSPAGTMSESSSGESPGLVPYTPGPITGIVNDLLTASIQGGSGGGPAGSTLYSLSGGNVPAATQAAFEQNLERSMADITESMGVVGNRFGTDLSRMLAEAANQANVALAAEAMDRALAATGQIIGLGTGQSALEFTGNENSLDRANQDFLATQNSDTELINLLIQMGLL